MDDLGVPGYPYFWKHPYQIEPSKNQWISEQKKYSIENLRNFFFGFHECQKPDPKQHKKQTPNEKKNTTSQPTPNLPPTYPQPSQPSQPSAWPSGFPTSVKGQRLMALLRRAIDSVGIAWHASSSPWRRSPVTTNAWRVVWTVWKNGGNTGKMGWNKGWDTKVYRWKLLDG